MSMICERTKLMHGGQRSAAFDPRLEADQEINRNGKKDDVVEPCFDGLHQFNEPDAFGFGALQTIGDKEDERPDQQCRHRVSGHSYRADWFADPLRSLGCLPRNIQQLLAQLGQPCTGKSFFNAAMQLGNRFDDPIVAKNQQA